MIHWIFDLFLALGSFYAGMRYGKYVLAAEQKVATTAQKIKNAL